jgi:hypothetical protein
MSEDLRPDAKRLLYLFDAGAIEGFANVEKDMYDYASELAERSGREEPNRMDELNAVRLLIDAAMAADEAANVTLAADDFDALADRIAQPGQPCPDVARVLSKAPPWESPTASEPPNYVRQCIDGTWEGADHPSGPWQKVSRSDVIQWSTIRKWLPTP